MADDGTEKRSKARPPKFTERLSLFMLRVAAFGAAYVLLDPSVWIKDGKFNFLLNSGGFSADLKGMVIAAILIGGWTAVKEFWLGASASGQDQAQSMSRIAEASTPAVANGDDH